MKVGIYYFPERLVVQEIHSNTSVVASSILVV
jgi:hypothetical protein